MNPVIIAKKIPQSRCKTAIDDQFMAKIAKQVAGETATDYEPLT
jgi:hypothetical protein